MPYILKTFPKYLNKQKTPKKEILTHYNCLKPFSAQRCPHAPMYIVSIQMKMYCTVLNVLSLCYGNKRTKVFQ